MADSNDDNEILLAEEISEHTPLEKELHLSWAVWLEVRHA